MTNDWEEQQIREFFQRIKQEDKKQTPSFSKVWAAANSRVKKTPTSRPGIRFAFASVIVILVVFTAVLFVKYSMVEPILEDSSEAILLSLRWQSPTDFLLQSTSKDLLTTVPQLGKSFFDIPSSDQQRNKEEL